MCRAGAGTTSGPDIVERSAGLRAHRARAQPHRNYFVLRGVTPSSADGLRRRGLRRRGLRRRGLRRRGLRGRGLRRRELRRRGLRKRELRRRGLRRRELRGRGLDGRRLLRRGRGRLRGLLRRRPLRSRGRLLRSSRARVPGLRRGCRRGCRDSGGHDVVLPLLWLLLHGGLAVRLPRREHHHAAGERGPRDGGQDREAPAATIGPPLPVVRRVLVGDHGNTQRAPVVGARSRRRWQRIDPPRRVVIGPTDRGIGSRRRARRDHRHAEEPPRLGLREACGRVRRGAGGKHLRRNDGEAVGLAP